MEPSMRLLPSNSDYARVAVWIFCGAWLIGNIALIIGLNGSGGEAAAFGMFAIACVAWWKAYRMGGTKNRAAAVIGSVVLGIWSLCVLSALLFAFRHYVADFFFWGVAGLLLLLGSATILMKGDDVSGS